MTEHEAKAALATEYHVPRETLDALERFVDFLCEQSLQQNLVSGPTLDYVWERHILDSAQLLRFAPNGGSWLDLGSGAGFPGLIVAAMGWRDVTLVESRKLRVAFLEQAAALLGVPVEVACTRVESLPASPYAVISARAFAPLPRLLALAHRFSAPATVWILPKGRGARDELEAVRGTWQGAFRIEPSITDADAGIIVATGVEPRTKA